MASATLRSSSSARISLQRVMHSLQMYTDGPEMNFRTESLDLPQNEQRRCLSLDMALRVRTGVGRSLEKCRSPPGASRDLGWDEFRALGDDVVDQAVFLGFLGAHEPVAVHVPL